MKRAAALPTRRNSCLLLSALILVIPLTLSACGSVHTPTAVTWMDHIGAHDRPTDWSRSIRGVGRRESPVNQGGREESELTRRLREVAGAHILVVPVGGLAGARDTAQAAEFLDRIEADGGAAWNEEVRVRAAAIRPVLEEALEINLQVGNEINSHFWGTSIGAWRGDRRPAGANSREVIPVYVEYFLAPAVEALREFDWGSDASAAKVNIVLGSVAAAANPSSRAWLGDLLDYRILGRYATSLAGLRVAEVVDFVSVHYLVTADDAGWMNTLDSLQERWVESGRIRGVWGTEELGRRRAEAGLGAVTAMKVTSRYLHWWSLRGLTPEKSRFFLWGSRLGSADTRGDSAMRVLHRVLGDSQLIDVSSSLSLAPRSRIEAYAFATAGDPAKRVIFVFPRPLGTEVAVRSISITTDWSDSTVTAGVHVFSAAGHRENALSVVNSGGELQFSFPDGLRLPPSSAAVLFVNRQLEGAGPPSYP
jgi:hypothetical protein